jgi:hypothetical protein
MPKPKKKTKKAKTPKKGKPETSPLPGAEGGKHPGGRPSKYSKELGLQICRRIAEGESVRHIVKDEKMPAASTIFRWLLDDEHKEFWEQYEKSRNIQAELMFEEILDIADENHDDWLTIEKKSGSYEIPNKEVVMRSRLRVDTRKWFLSKVLPKKFGDKMDITSGNKPIPLLNVLRNNRNKKDSGSN